MKKNSFGVAFLFLFFVVSVQAQLVKTNAGIVKGATEGDVTIFKGIPYATQPVGEFRLYSIHSMLQVLLRLLSQPSQNMN
jgi:para-nitrobenzyl esterase